MKLISVKKSFSVLLAANFHDVDGHARGQDAGTHYQTLPVDTADKSVEPASDASN